MSDRPVIYLIDDEDQSSAAFQLEQLGAEATYLYPTEVTDDHLSKATLLAVDEFFDLRAPAPNEDWDVPRDLPPALVPSDGLALAAVLRSAAHNMKERATNLGITLRTGDLDALTHGLPRMVRQPLVAAQYDIEWALPKADTPGSASSAEQLVSLAFALHNYPSDWESNSPIDVGIGWIGIPHEPWKEDAKTHVAACRPPTNTATTTAHGLTWLRWLAHRALPYPAFVVADVYAATMLGVTVDSFRTVASDSSSEIGQILAPVAYRGPLFDLYKARYWRAGLAHIARGVVSDEFDADDPQLVGEALSRRFDGLIPLDMGSPVVAIDENYSPLDEPVERNDAVRLAPDGWPPFADPAWANRSSAISPGLARLVAPSLR